MFLTLFTAVGYEAQNPKKGIDMNFRETPEGFFGLFPSKKWAS